MATTGIGRSPEGRMAAGRTVSRRGSAGARTSRLLQAAWQQPALMAVIIGLTDGLSIAHAGVIARLFFIAAAVVCAAFYIRRSPWDYITLTLWFWTLTPFARRLVDEHAGFDPVNFMLITPNLLTLFMLKDVLVSRELLRLRESVVGFLLVLPVAYGLCVSFARGEIVPGTIAAADWIGPLLYYFYVITHWRRIGEAEASFQGFLAINGIVMIGYGLYQYLSPPPWDVDWVLDSGMISSIGHPLPRQVRIFGTLNAPGVLAFWLGAILLLCLHFRSLLTIFIVPVGAVVLALTLVRSVAGTVVMGLALAGAMGRASTFKVLSATLVAVVVVLGGLSAVDPDMAEHLAKRFSTLNNLDQDQSALAREDLYRRTPAMIAANPLGVGIGGIGRGAVASNNADMITIDSGLLATYLALGWFGGSVYLAGLGLALLQGLLAARITRSPVALALAVTATATAANIVFTNITSFFAATIWICSAYAAAIGVEGRERPMELGVLGTRGAGGSFGGARAHDGVVG